MYELLIKEGRVIDPGQRINDIRDVAISSGKVASVARDIPAALSERVINARGKIVTPGLIDLHTHVADGLIALGVRPDDAGVFSGVTTVCDAGSTGHANFINFRNSVAHSSRTDIFCFLNLAATGLAVMPEIRSWDHIDPEAAIAVIEENRNMIKGIKLRATGALIQNLGLEAVKAAKRIASDTGLPLMIHLGVEPEEPISAEIVNTFTREMLSLLDRGDILTHIYTWKKGGVITPDGRIFSELREALQREVFLDLANAKTHFCSRIAQIGLDQGILPATASTDLAITNINDSVYSLPVTMSKLLALGFDLEHLIKMTTINPARLLAEEHNRGTLLTGMPADISILELAEGDFLFADGKIGKSFKGKYLLIPRLTLKSGLVIETQPRFQ